MKLPGSREKVSYPVECVFEVLSSTGGGGEGSDGRPAAPAASAHGARVQVPTPGNPNHPGCGYEAIVSREVCL